MTDTLFSAHVPHGTHAGRPGAATVPTSTLYACSDHHLVYQSDGTSWSTWYDPGSLAGATVRDRRWLPAVAETSIDEFNDSSLDGAWVRVDGTGAASGNAAWTEDADSLSVANIGGDSANVLHALVRPIGTSMVAGDAFTTCLTIFGEPGVNYLMGGLVLADGTTHGSGGQAVALSFMDTTSKQLNACWNFTGYNAAPGVATYTKAAAGVRTFVRLALISTGTWRAEFSPDGVTWHPTKTTISKSFTPTHVGLLSSSWGTSTPHVVSYEFLRRSSGVT